jgi:hypothetical protein
MMPSTQRSATVAQSPLAGTPLAIDVDEVIAGWVGPPRLFAGHSPDGQRWLVAQVSDSDTGPRRWLCAPASERAIGCVVSGIAAPTDVLRHSTTGTVEDITICPDGRICESVRMCAELGDEELLSVSGESLFRS